jgi:hypothetical protein
MQRSLTVGGARASWWRRPARRVLFAGVLFSVLAGVGPVSVARADGSGQWVGGAGQLGAPRSGGAASGVPLPPGGLDDADTVALTYAGSWTHYAGSATADAYDGTESWSNTTGDSVQFTFTGTGINIYGPRQPNLGRAGVEVDGLISLFDQYSPSPPRAARQLVWSSPTLPYGTHFVTITVSGRKYVDSSGTTVQLDAVVPLGVAPLPSGWVDDANTTSLDYSGVWTHYAGALTANAYDSTESWSSTTGDSVRFKFTGNGVSLYGPMQPNLGIADVSVDGVPSGSFDQYSPLSRWPRRLLWYSPAVPFGTHTVTITVSGQKDARSSSATVQLDAVQPRGVPLPSGWVDDADTTAVAYAGSWTHYGGPLTADAYDGTESWSSTTGDSVQFKFAGTGLDLYGPKQPNLGIADVSVDGAPMGSFDQYDPTPRLARQMLWTSQRLPFGLHVVTVTVSGRKDTGSSGTTVQLDAYQPLP